MPDFLALINDTADVADTVCTRTEMTFTNTSSGFYTHRQYNLNQFYLKWNLGTPFPSSVTSVFSSDSSITWYFEFFDSGERPDPRVFLPYTNTGTISAITANSYYPDCFILNQFRARLKPMSAFGRGVQMAYTEGFTACFKYCNGDTVGIADWNNEPLPILYPNPTANSKITLSGLTRDASISIYNALGQQLLYTETNAPETELDFSQFPEGMYTVRLLSAGQKVRIYKVIHTP